MQADDSTRLLIDLMAIKKGPAKLAGPFGFLHAVASDNLFENVGSLHYVWPFKDDVESILKGLCMGHDVPTRRRYPVPGTGLPTAIGNPLRSH